MPVIVLPHSVFVHSPKCGGTTITECLKNIDLPYEELGPMLCIEELKNLYKDKRLFSFVRHPVDWWLSLWHFQLRIRPGRPFEECWTEDDKKCDLFNWWQYTVFEDFIKNIALGPLKGFCGTLLRRQCFGKLGNEINFIGKYENLTKDLIHALQWESLTKTQHAKVEQFMMYNKLNKRHPHNLSDYLSDETKQELINAEYDIMENFGYDFGDKINLSPKSLKIYI